MVNRRVHFCGSYTKALIYADQNDGMLLSANIHPDDNHKALFHFNNGMCPLIVADISMVTGWRVAGEDIAITYDDSFPANAPERAQAASRVANPLWRLI